MRTPPVVGVFGTRMRRWLYCTTPCGKQVHFSNQTVIPLSTESTSRSSSTTTSIIRHHYPKPKEEGKEVSTIIHQEDIRTEGTCVGEPVCIKFICWDEPAQRHRMFFELKNHKQWNNVPRDKEFRECQLGEYDKAVMKAGIQMKGKTRMKCKVRVSRGCAGHTVGKR